MQLEESNVIGIDETTVQATAQVWGHYLRILGSILLLGSVWCLLFIWGLMVTQQWLAWWMVQPTAPPDKWQTALANLLQTGSGLYLPACALVLISLAIFFYRVPRVPSRLTVPIEFGLITIGVLTLNVLMLQLLHQVTYSVMRASSASAMGTPPPLDIDRSTLITEVGLAVTIVMIGLLFWLQATGFLRSVWRRWRRRA